MNSIIKSVVIVTSLVVSSARIDAQTASVSSIDISTGRNHIANSNLQYSGSSGTVSDDYWQVTMVPTNTVGLVPPFCAKLLDSTIIVNTVPNGPFVNQVPAPAGCRWIGVAKNPTAYTGGLNAPSGFFWTYNGSPISGAKPVRFTRKFQVTGSTAQAITVTLNSGASDDVMFVRVDAAANTPIYGTPSGNVFYNTNAITTTSINGPITSTLQLSPGVHTLDVDVYDVAGHITSLALQGTISATTNVLSSNVNYGVNASCSTVGTPCDLTDIGYSVKQTNPSLYTFSATVSPAGSSVKWIFGDGTNGTYAPGQAVTHQYAVSGSYKVCAQVVASGSQCPERCMNICVADSGALGITNSNSEGLSFELNNPYPNPTTHNIIIPVLSPVSHSVTVRVLDVNGVELISKQALLHAGQDEVQLPVNNLSPGIYLIEMSSAAGRQVKLFSKIY